MDILILDRSHADILHDLCVDDWKSELKLKHQNKAERHNWRVKEATNRVLSLTVALSYCGLLCIEYVCFVQNQTAAETLAWCTPL